MLDEATAAAAGATANDGGEAAARSVAPGVSTGAVRRSRYSTRKVRLRRRGWLERFGTSLARAYLVGLSALDASPGDVDWSGQGRSGQRLGAPSSLLFGRARGAVDEGDRATAAAMSAGGASECGGNGSGQRRAHHRAEALHSSSRRGDGYSAFGAGADGFGSSSDDDAVDMAHLADDGAQYDMAMAANVLDRAPTSFDEVDERRPSEKQRSLVHELEALARHGAAAVAAAAHSLVEMLPVEHAPHGGAPVDGPKPVPPPATETPTSSGGAAAPELALLVQQQGLRRCHFFSIHRGDGRTVIEICEGHATRLCAGDYADVMVVRAVADGAATGIVKSSSFAPGSALVQSDITSSWTANSTASPDRREWTGGSQASVMPPSSTPLRAPVPTASLLDALAAAGIDVAQLAAEAKPQRAYRRHYSAWITNSLRRPRPPGIECKRLLVMDDSGALPCKRLLQNAFAFLTLLATGRNPLKSVLLPVTAEYGADLVDVLSCAVDTALRWCSAGMPLQVVRIVVPPGYCTPPVLQLLASFQDCVVEPGRYEPNHGTQLGLNDAGATAAETDETMAEAAQREHGRRQILAKDFMLLYDRADKKIAWELIHILRSKYSFKVFDMHNRALAEAATELAERCDEAGESGDASSLAPSAYANSVRDAGGNTGVEVWDRVRTADAKASAMPAVEPEAAESVGGAEQRSVSPASADVRTPEPGGEATSAAGRGISPGRDSSDSAASVRETSTAVSTANGRSSSPADAATAMQPSSAPPPANGVSAFTDSTPASNATRRSRDSLPADVTEPPVAVSAPAAAAAAATTPSPQQRLTPLPLGRVGADAIASSNAENEAAEAYLADEWYTALLHARRVVAIISDNFFRSSQCRTLFSLAACRNLELSGEGLFIIYWQSADLPAQAQRLLDTNAIDCREMNRALASDALLEFAALHRRQQRAEKIARERSGASASGRRAGEVLPPGVGSLQAPPAGLAKRLQRRRRRAGSYGEAASLSLLPVRSTTGQRSADDTDVGSRPATTETEFFDDAPILFDPAWRAQWDIPHDELQLGTKLGAGAFGEVYMAEWRGQVVAVKQLTRGDEGFTLDVVEDFQKEMMLLSGLRHPNIVPFYGAVTRPPHLCIVLGFVSGGSLYRLIHSRNLDDEQPFTAAEVAHLALGIARGMHYLHSQTPPVVHRDLKSPNVLINADTHDPVVTDFGLSRSRVSTMLMTGAAGTPEWMAPEIMRQEAINEKSDVWSYGVIVWELITCQKPWADEHPIQVIYRVAQRREALRVPPGTDAHLRVLVEACLQHNSKRRPSFGDIVEFWEALQAKRSSDGIAANGSGRSQGGRARSQSAGGPVGGKSVVADDGAVPVTDPLLLARIVERRQRQQQGATASSATAAHEEEI